MPDEIIEPIYEAPRTAILNREELDALLSEAIRNSLLPSWYQDLTKTAISRNITLDDWNTLCYLLRRVSADKVSYTTFKEYSDAICNYMNDNFSLKGHNLVSVRIEGDELCFEFEDGGYFYLNASDLGFNPISDLELRAILR